MIKTKRQIFVETPGLASLSAWSVLISLSTPGVGLPPSLERVSDPAPCFGGQGETHTNT